MLLTKEERGVCVVRAANFTNVLRTVVIGTVRVCNYLNIIFLYKNINIYCNRSSDAQISLHNLVPTTDSDASHIHCTLNCICKKDHDILYHGTMYHTPLNNTQFSIDAYNALIASIYLHQYFCILKILAHSVDFNELYRNVTIHCPSFSLVR